MIKKVFLFYRDGFRNLTVGKTLWKIILIKLFIMFAIFRTFLFNDTLAKRFETQEQIQQHIFQELTEKKIQIK